MSIQASINQGISLTAMLYSQTPHAAAKREKAAIAQREQEEKAKVQRQISTYNAMAEHGIETEEIQTEEELAPQLHIAQVGRDTYRRAFELDPTEENLRHYTGQEADVRGLEARREQIREGQASEREKAARAARQAEEAQAAEQERLARSRQFQEQVMSGVYPESMGVRERITRGGN